jgi:hypothetical protein
LIVEDLSPEEAKKMTREELAKHQITLQDSEFFDTMNGQTLLTNTDKFYSEMTLSSKPPEIATMQKINSEMSMQSSNLFNLSEDSSVKLSSNGMLNSFITTMDGKGSSTLKSGMSSSYNDSMSYSKTGLSFSKQASK